MSFDILDVSPELADDAQALAHAIILSLQADVGRGCALGDRTSALLHSAFDGSNDARATTTLFIVADIAQAAIAMLLANGIDVRDQLASPYLMPEDIS